MGSETHNGISVGEAVKFELDAFQSRSFGERVNRGESGDMLKGAEYSTIFSLRIMNLTFHGFP